MTLSHGRSRLGSFLRTGGSGSWRRTFLYGYYPRRCPVVTARRAKTPGPTQLQHVPNAAPARPLLPIYEGLVRSRMQQGILQVASENSTAERSQAATSRQRLVLF